MTLRNLLYITIASSFILLGGCHTAVEPTVQDNHLIPLASNITWTYNISYYDSMTKTPPSHGVWTEGSQDFPMNHGLSYEWDSTGSRWRQVPFMDGYELGCNMGLWIENLIFAPLSDGSGNGIMCGTDYLDGGLLYWFMLPDRPSSPLHFRANSLTDVENGDTAGGVFFADLDTSRYLVSVPAGSFSTYKLTVRFVGQIGIGAVDSLYDTDTLYLVPGKGIVKRIYIHLERINDLPNPAFFNASNNCTTYELSK